MTDSAELKKLVKQLQSASTDEVFAFFFFLFSSFTLIGVRFVRK